MQNEFFTPSELPEVSALARGLVRRFYGKLSREDIGRLRQELSEAAASGGLRPSRFGINPVLLALRTATELCTALSPDSAMVTALLVAPIYAGNEAPEAASLSARWGDDVARLVSGLRKVSSIYAHAATVQSDNFRKLLLTFAEDIRVIILMIVDRLVLMRAVNHHPDEKAVKELAHEANYLYAPLAHRLGLYGIKSQLEDMALKYGNREIFSTIARQLNETNTSRRLSPPSASASKPKDSTSKSRGGQRASRRYGTRSRNSTTRWRRFSTFLPSALCLTCPATARRAPAGSSTPS